MKEHDGQLYWRGDISIDLFSTHCLLQKLRCVSPIKLFAKNYFTMLKCFYLHYYEITRKRGHWCMKISVIKLSHGPTYSVHC